MSSARAAKIWRRTKVGASLAAALALLLWLAARPGGERLVLAVGFLLALGGIWELVRMGVVGRGLGACSAVLALCASSFVLLDVGERAAGLQPYTLDPALKQGLAAGVALFFAIGTGLNPGKSVKSGWLAFLSTLCVVLALPGLVGIRVEYGPGGLIALLVLCKIGDIAGYYVGSAIGKSHPFPKISPGKTSAGCVGSLVAGTLAGALLQATGVLPDPRWGPLSGLVAGALVNLSAQAGDLFESLVKRRAGVKDSGNWFGPSGGVLDLVDSLLFAVPLAVVSWPLLFVGLTGP